MTWREDLRRVRLLDGRQLIGASFRGKPFFVESSERSGGRRTVVHEFPLRDDPFVEDLGRRARTFRVEGYVIGDDYLTQRDVLLAALEAPSGPGELVHPYHGIRRAVCVNLTVRESRAEGGIAVFSIEFAEAPTQAPTPTIEVDAASTVSAKADVAVAATKAEFSEKYSAAGLPSFALASASGALSTASAGLGAALSPVVGVTQELAAMSAQISFLTTQASALVRSPDDIVDAFRGAITVLGTTIADSPGAVLNALADSYGIDLGPDVDPTTATRAREAANQDALNGALRRVLALEAARLAPLVPFESTDEAIATRDRIAAMLEEQANGAGDTAYPALVDLRSELLRAVPGATTFASVITVTRNTAIPSLVLAYQLHGDVDQEADIVARNAIRHPGFVAGQIKALSDVG